MRTMTTTLDELNDDEPGNEDVPPHHHRKLTTRTTTRRRCSEAQDRTTGERGDDEDAHASAGWPLPAAGFLTAAGARR